MVRQLEQNRRSQLRLQVCQHQRDRLRMFFFQELGQLLGFNASRPGKLRAAVLSGLRNFPQHHVAGLFAEGFGQQSLHIARTTPGPCGLAVRGLMKFFQDFVRNVGRNILQSDQFLGNRLYVAFRQLAEHRARGLFP